MAKAAIHTLLLALSSMHAHSISGEQFSELSASDRRIYLLGVVDMYRSYNQSVDEACVDEFLESGELEEAVIASTRDGLISHSPVQLVAARWVERACFEEWGEAEEGPEDEY